MNVELVQQRVAVLRDRGGEHNDLVQLAHTLEECVDTGSLDDIDIMRLSLNLDGYREVGLMQDLSMG